MGPTRVLILDPSCICPRSQGLLGFGQFISMSPGGRDASDMSVDMVLANNVHHGSYHAMTAPPRWMLACFLDHRHSPNEALESQTGAWG